MPKKPSFFERLTGTVRLDETEEPEKPIRPKNLTCQQTGKNPLKRIIYLKRNQLRLKKKRKKKSG